MLGFKNITNPLTTAVLLHLIFNIHLSRLKYLPRILFRFFNIKNPQNATRFKMDYYFIVFFLGMRTYDIISLALNPHLGIFIYIYSTGINSHVCALKASRRHHTLWRCTCQSRAAINALLYKLYIYLLTPQLYLTSNATKII